MMSASTTGLAVLGGHQSVMDLVRRLELWPQLLRRQEEEAIVRLVELEPEWLERRRQELLADRSLAEVLAEKGWSEEDFELDLARPEALQRFARQQFGPGLEERFLAAQGGHDQVIYSLLRVRDPALAQELWIRLEEGETTFAEAASSFGEGPEAALKGLIGPQPVGQLQPPELVDILRCLRPGQLHPPRRFGEWSVLLRLEQLTPSRFDEAMQQFLLNEQLEAFLKDRVRTRLEGETPSPLHYVAEGSAQP